MTPGKIPFLFMTHSRKKIMIRWQEQSKASLAATSVPEMYAGQCNKWHMASSCLVGEFKCQFCFALSGWFTVASWDLKLVIKEHALSIKSVDSTSSAFPLVHTDEG